MQNIIEVEVPTEVNALVRAYAAENKITLPEAYKRLVDAGLKALGCGDLTKESA